MIAARTTPDFGGLAGRLAERAKAIALAQSEARVLERRQDPNRWRSAKLLWPLFTKD